MLASEFLAQKISDLPQAPGVYLMKDASGSVIYVGKAAHLRNRVRSYFHAVEGLSPRIRSMVSQIADCDFLVVRNELEAFMLESNLIKQHRPRYNVRLRDDKQYPYLRITLQEDFPRVERVRRVDQDGARYYGPFASSKSLNETLQLIRRLFPYRTCDLPLAEGQIDPMFRPCLEFHIKRCVAPCNGSVTCEEYRQVIQRVCLFLDGRSDEVIRMLRQEMEVAADALAFERAAHIRDQIQAVQRVIERQRVVSPQEEDQDALGFARDALGACVEILFARRGKVIGSDRFFLDTPAESSDGEVLAAFIQQFYSRAALVPEEILLPLAPDDRAELEALLRSLTGSSVRLVEPKRGAKRDFVQLAQDNAQRDLAEERARWTSSRQKTVEAARELAEALGLSRFPHRIECYDNSNIQGRDAVAAMVVFLDGQPAKGEYRKFKIKTVEGPDDFRSMGEVVRRRFRRLAQSRAQQGELGNGGAGGWMAVPDLVVVDGGKGQLRAAVEALAELGLLEDIPIVALAKQREEIFSPTKEESLLLPRTSAALHLVQRLRDETHRFAITFHRQQRQHAGLRSALDGVTGIGPRRKQLLLRRFGSIQGIANAPVEELIEIPGITEMIAQRVKLMLGHIA